MEEKMKQKNSGLGIAGLIMAIIPCTSFIGLMLSIIDVCKKDGKKKTCAIIGIVISGLYMLISLTSMVGAGGNSNVTVGNNIPTEQQRTETEEKDKREEQTEEDKKEMTELQEDKTATTEKESFLEELKKVLDEDVAEKSYDILVNQIGFSEIEYKEKMDGLTNYEITANGYNVVLTASDDVYRIFIPSSSYVFYEDGELKLKLSDLEDRVIDYNDRTVYYIMAQDIVCSGLKNPNSADFPSIVTHPEETSMQKNGDIVAVQSYVEVKNDFGMKVRNNFVVEFRVIDMDSYSYELIYINIEGQESGEFINLD